MKEKVVKEFVEELVKSPTEVMSLIHLHLAHTDFELRLLKANILKEYEKAWREQPSFSFETAQKGVPIYQIND